jgi:F-type H+-transporting ATPase subunit epsilon
MAKLQVQLVTPERTVLSEELDSLTCPTTEGLITILPGHAPLVATLTSGELTAKSKQDSYFIHVAGGFVEIRPDNKVTILADGAEHAYEIDIERAEQAKQEAEKLLQQQTTASEEYATTAWMLQKNLNRIKIARKHSHRRNDITHKGVFNQ